MLFGKKNNQNELEYIEKQIGEQKEYLNVINSDIKSLLVKKSELQEECNKCRNEYNRLKVEYENLQSDYDRLKAEYDGIRKYSIEYVDSLEGLAFEEYVGEMLENIGYSNVSITKASNDYGVDVLAEKDNIKYAIQCKNYSSPLGNTCVQEVYSGKNYYNCHVAAVITNTTFTKNAEELAQKDGVLLWDRNSLIEMIRKYAINKGYNVNDTNTKPLRNNTVIKEQNIEEYDDPLYDEIVEFVISTRKASASILQRRFKLGYNRAARIIDLLEERGVIGPQNGSSPREVLLKFNVNEE